jgi:hypothetical protein
MRFLKTPITIPHCPERDNPPFRVRRLLKLWINPMRKIGRLCLAIALRPMRIAYRFLIHGAAITAYDNFADIHA